MSNISFSFTSEVIVTGTNSVSVLVCLLAAFLVYHLRLYRTVVYRLSFYQVLASLASATVDVFQIIFIDYSKAPKVYDHVCIAIGWMTMYTQWVKVLFTTWVTVHLFYFAVLQKNLKKFEVLYVVTSLLIPALIAAIPLTTRTYGLNKLGFCFLNDTARVAIIERFSLWYGPALLILLALSIAMVVMVITLARRVYSRSKYEPITEGDQFWTAVKQLLPLSAFPILFFIFLIPVFIDAVRLSESSVAANKSLSVTLLFISLWSMSSGVTLIIHISVVRCFSKRKRKLNSNNIQPPLQYSELK